MKTAPPLYEALPTPEEMSRWDEAAHDLFGIPPLLLMENAARAALDVLREHAALSPDCGILVFMGKGNNGGDGAALARLLHDEGCKVLVCPTQPLVKLREPARKHVAMARKIGVGFMPPLCKGVCDLPPEWTLPHVIVDAIAGTGLRGDLREPELDFVRLINKLGERSFVLSLDIPSGLCGLTGRPKPECVKANATVAFEAGKPGLFMPQAAEYTGRLTVRRVGIPQATRSAMPPSWKLLAPRKGGFAPPASARHKGDAGKVLVIGGSQGMAGAPFLAARGALRAGAGLVHVVYPGSLAPQGSLAEMQLHPLGEGTSFRRKHADMLCALIDTLRPDALVVGPGFGRHPGGPALLEAVLNLPGRPPLVADADALYPFRVDTAFPDHGEWLLPLTLLGGNDIATPHPGELARMLPGVFFTETGRDTGQPQAEREKIRLLQQNRPEALTAFTGACPAVLVLKGAGTLIGQRNAPTILSPFAVPTLAIGGSGDVLAGVIAALAAAGYPSFDAASLGVYLHARAGERLAEQAPLGHLASAVADALPGIWMELCGG